MSGFKIQRLNKGGDPMKIISSFIISMMLLICFVLDANGKEKEKPGPSSGASLAISSPAFAPGAVIPADYTCSGGDYSPALQWEHAPAGTRSFALIVDDPDAPAGIFTHWMIFNIPADQTSLAEKASPNGALPSGAIEGLNDFGRIGYGGPCPPPGRAHRYVFKLYALDAVLKAQTTITKAGLVQAMKGHILVETQMTAIFGRQH